MHVHLQIYTTLNWLCVIVTKLLSLYCIQTYIHSMLLHIYRIASNYGPGVYFIPEIFNLTTKRDRRLLSEETRAVYNL